MILSRYNLKNINADLVSVPDMTVFDLPEKVLQFGTGAFLRGFAGYYIDKANRRDIFNGRIVVVKSTAVGDTQAFQKQDGLYTLGVRGLSNGQESEEYMVNASISRVLNATEQWGEILECAHDAQMQIILSNTTEAGICLVTDDVRQHPPKSFPGKLLAFLYERFKAFGGSEHSGMIIVPTELIPDNGRILEAIVLELAHLNGLDDDFIEWVEKHNRFCNSLVDRIVPGMPETRFREDLENRLGYSDDLMVVAEPYSLWAIEGDDEVRDVLSFAQADESIIIRPDIGIYRELKLRMLNGAHSLTCGLAILSGCRTVREAMEDNVLSHFISSLLQTEISPCISGQTGSEAARLFGKQVLDRFSNPHIRHSWSLIAAQYSSKMSVRCVPVLLKYMELNQRVPELIALGFAAYLRFTRPVIKKGNLYYGELNGEHYLIQDAHADAFYIRWATLGIADLVRGVLQDETLWDRDLNSLPGFAQMVTDQLNSIIQSDVRSTIEVALSKKVMMV